MHVKRSQKVVQDHIQMNRICWSYKTGKMTYQSNKKGEIRLYVAEVQMAFVRSKLWLKAVQKC